MRPFLSHLIHSRPGRAMAWLAWLVLVASPVHGGPSALLGGSAHGAHVASLVSDVGHAGQHAAVETADHCCMDMHPDGHAASGGCQCASLCASTLPAVAALIPGRMAASDPPASPGPVSAPPGAHVRLLRPPAA
ncbi:MAG TPA: hypothetical protein VIL60_09815 [Rhodanobacter sp.]